MALQDSQVPQLSIWYTAPLQFKKTEKGVSFLLFRGHRYNHKNTNRRGIHCWKCYKYKCRATVFTRGLDNIKLGFSGHNHSRCGSHQKSHPDDLDRQAEDPDNPPPLLEGVIPTAQMWYSVPLEFVENKNGNMNLVFRGYTYNEAKRSKSNAITWVCSKLGCGARATSRGVDRLRLGTREHSHEPSLSYVDPLTLMANESEVKAEPADFVIDLP